MSKVSMKKLFLSFSILCFFIGCGCSSSDIDKTMERGNAVVLLIDQYKNKEGSYPKSLDPFSEEIEKKSLSPVCGSKKWEYGTFEHEGKTHYYLRVYEESDWDTAIFYASNKNTWSVDTK